MQSEISQTAARVKLHLLQDSAADFSLLVQQSERHVSQRRRKRRPNKKIRKQRGDEEVNRERRKAGQAQGEGSEAGKGGANRQRQQVLMEAKGDGLGGISRSLGTLMC